jgi:hypothetical protein
VSAYIYFYSYEAALLYLSASLRSRYFLYLAVILAIVFSGFRLNVGVDYSSYVYLFAESRNIDISFHEPLTSIFAKVNALISSGSSLIFLCYAAITLGGVFYYIFHFSPSWTISIYLFLFVPIFYLATFNAVRQWAAIAMILVSLVFLEQRKFFKMTLAAIIGSMLHISALIMCLLPLFQFRYSKKVLVAVFFSIILLSKAIIEIILLTPYALYLGELFTGGWSFLTIIYFGMLIYFVNYFDYFNKSVQMSRSQIIACNMNLASVLVLLGGYVLELDFLTIMRLNNYFIIQLIILIPMWLKSRHGRFLRIYYLVVLALPFAYLLYTLLVNGGNYMLTPYDAIYFS